MFHEHHADVSKRGFGLTLGLGSFHPRPERGLACFLQVWVLAPPAPALLTRDRVLAPTMGQSVRHSGAQGPGVTLTILLFKLLVDRRRVPILGDRE